MPELMKFARFVVASSDIPTVQSFRVSQTRVDSAAEAMPYNSTICIKSVVSHWKFGSAISSRNAGN